ncbi:hypothetical protein IJ670_06285, partial [bacterium]|nr:hypothetical protein [bacterium]
MINNVSQVSPLLMKQLNKAQVNPNPPEVKTEEIKQADIVGISPLLVKTLMAQRQQILPINNVVQTPSAMRVEGYKNNLKDMMLHNRANIFAVILRTMNAKDEDGNELIQGNEQKGNFINDIERLDEIKALGFNTLHVLPIHQPGKVEAMGTAGSLYAPKDFLSLDPELVDENPPKEIWDKVAEIYEQKTGKKLEKMDKNDPEVAFSQYKLFVDECHKRGIKVMQDLPSCCSVDFANAHPDMIATGPDGKPQTPGGWQDIRMLAANEKVLDMFKKYVDMCVDCGVDGIRADVGRAKPVEFWDIIIKYSHLKDPQFAWLAESYTHEDASPQLNMPYDRPADLLDAGFDAVYGQWHIVADWTPQTIYDYVIENLEMNNKMGKPKSLISDTATHDDVSPMLYGGAPWVMQTTALQAMLPQANFYMTDGVQTGDYYMFPYDGATVNEETYTGNKECFVHTGRMDIFNNSRKPGGTSPEIAQVVKASLALKNNTYNELNPVGIKLEMDNSQDVLTKGSFIILPTNNPELMAFARHKDGKTLVYV